MGVACGPKGVLTITDNDRIEVSNLNRQFLFRGDNVGQQKSEAAAARATVMNSAIKINAMGTLVAPNTEDVFHEQVSFQWKNPDFLLRNPDFRLKNVDFIIKQEKEEHKEDPVAKLTDLFHNIDDDQTGWVDSKVRTQEIYQAPACIYPPELISARCCRNYMKVCSAEVLVSPPRRSMSCSPLGITTATVG